MAVKRKKGRPVTVGKDPVVTSVRLSRKQDRAVARAARKCSMTKSGWMRHVLTGYAQL